MSVNPPVHVVNWFFHFLIHKSNHLIEEDLDHFSKHPINGENKRIKVFKLIVIVLTVIVRLPLHPPIKKAYHGLLVVGVTFGVPKYDINDGVSLTLPYPHN